MRRIKAISHTSRHIPRLRAALQRGGQHLLEFLAPRHCELCGGHIGADHRRFEFACDACVDALPPAPAPDELLNRPAARAGHASTALDAVYARYLLRREANTHKLVHALKYRGCRRIGIEFGAELARTLSHLNYDDVDALVPVPLHAARRRERGFNQAEILARGAAAVLQIPVYPQALQRGGYTASQTGLTALERQDARRRNFRPGPQISAVRNAHVLIIDDVFTTGATVNACARTLREQGVRRIEAAALAAAE